jgi:putative transposase
MAESPPETTIERSTASLEQLSFPIAPQAWEEIALLVQEGEEQWEIVVSEATIEVQQRIEIIQTLISAQGLEGYGKLQQQAAKKLGISVRSLQRMVKRWREQGLSALSKPPRVDHGASKISSKWQDFILKTYREGNCGSRSLTPAQVVLRVRARAQELGVEDYPKRTTVYSILQPEIEKKQAKRSLLLARRPIVDYNARGDRVSDRVEQSSVAMRPHEDRCFSGGSGRGDVRATVVNDRGRYLFPLHYGSASRV